MLIFQCNNFQEIVVFDDVYKSESKYEKGIVQQGRKVGTKLKGGSKEPNRMKDLMKINIENL